jgi:hypothetical protein
MGASDAMSGRLAINLARLYAQSQLPTARLPPPASSATERSIQRGKQRQDAPLRPYCRTERLRKDSVGHNLRLRSPWNAPDPDAAMKRAFPSDRPAPYSHAVLVQVSAIPDRPHTRGIHTDPAPWPTRQASRLLQARGQTDLIAWLTPGATSVRQV